jgi:hypothetical protein
MLHNPEPGGIRKIRHLDDHHPCPFIMSSALLD